MIFTVTLGHFTVRYFGGGYQFCVSKISKQLCNIVAVLLIINIVINDIKI